MRALIDAMGAEPLLRASGLKSEPYSSSCRQGALSDLLGARQAGENFFAGFAAPFGRFLAGEFAGLADAAFQGGAKELRLTPWRAIRRRRDHSNKPRALARRRGRSGSSSTPGTRVSPSPPVPARRNVRRRKGRRGLASTPSPTPPRRCRAAESAPMCRAAPRAAPSLRRRRSRSSPMAGCSISSITAPRATRRPRRV